MTDRANSGISRSSFGAEFRAAPTLWLLLVAAIMFGGGGRGAPMANLAVQLAALAALAFSMKQVGAGWRNLATPLKILVVLTAGLPLVQLVPLPPAIWTALPGRGLITESLALIDVSDRWMPVSVVPAMTLLAFTGLVAPIAVLLLLAARPASARDTVLQFLIAGGILSVLLGAIQLGTAGSVGNLYGSRDPSYLYGFFANHNSAGLFLVLSLCALVEYLSLDGRAKRMIVGAIVIAILLTVGVLLTQSRSSIVLLLVPVGLASIKLTRAAIANGRSRKSVFGIFIAAIFAVGAMATLAAGQGRVAQSIERFSSFEDSRPELWSDAGATIQRFGIFGSGTGTFDDVIQLDESLETLQAQRAGRAHNDYLELAVESGIVGVSLLFMWAVYVAVSLFTRQTGRGASISFGLAVTAVYMAQSLLDYPLRSQALLCAAAALVAILNVGHKTMTKDRVGAGNE